MDKLYKKISITLIFFAILSYFFGFYLGENSAGAGGYNGDLDDIWKNLQIFLQNDLITSIKHPDYDDSRTPIAYIIHETFNPFLGDQDSFRTSVVLISLLLPLLFYFTLKQKFQNEQNLLLGLIASIIFISPYFRTSSYWGLQENYGLIFLVLTFLSDIYLNSEKNKLISNEYLKIFFITFLSSLCLYFDQKLIIVPIIYFSKFMLSKKLIKYKIFLILCYFIFSLPYIYLISLWGSFIPTGASKYRQLGQSLFLEHVGFTVTMIAFYILPFLFLKKEKFIVLIKNVFKNKKNYLLIFLSLLYLIYMIFFFDLSDKIHGKGFINKISFILFSDNYFRLIFIYTTFLISWVIILAYFQNYFKDLFIVLFFLILSIFLYPIFQEYFDPLIFIMIFTFFSPKIYFSYKNSIILFSYFLFFLVSANIYYINLFN